MASREHVWTIVRGQAGVLLLMAVVALGTGFALRAEEEVLFDRPWILALVPLINALGGNLGAVLGARLTSALHLGLLEPRFRRGPLTENLALIVTASITVYGILTLVIFLVAPHLALFPGLRLAQTAALVFGSGILLTVGVIGLSTSSAFVAYRKGLDPDDIVIPVVTNVTDLLGVLVLLGVSEMVL